MASGFKTEMPKEIYVIFNGFEARYYTTPESFAQALSEGYGHHQGKTPYAVEIFLPMGLVDDQWKQKVEVIVKRRPPQPTPVAWQGPANLTQPPSPAQQAANKAAYDKAARIDKTNRKKYKDQVVADLAAARNAFSGRTP